jgi:UDP-glucose 4-epimerase
MILITGGLGFIGVGLARYILEQGKEVLLTRRRTSRIPGFLKDYLDKELRVVDSDILDLPNLLAILKEHRVESIVHTAMITLAKASLYQGFKASLEGTVNVLEAARLMGIKRVTYTSSVTVYYGIKGETPYEESMALPIDLRHPIGSEKISVEALGTLYAEHYGLELIITRPSMVYGPHSVLNIGPMTQMVEGALNKKRVVLPQFYSGFSTDFIYIDDCSRAIGTVHLAKEPKHTVYNVASGKTYSLKQVSEVIEKIIPDCSIELQGKPTPWSSSLVDIGRLREEFGYEPEYDLEQGIRKYIDWIKEGKK